MPRRELTTEERLIEKVKSNQSVLSDLESTLDDIKEIVCPFYKGGNNPNCKHCHQPEHILTVCKDTYLDKIQDRPMEVWSPEFDLLEVREKKKVSKETFRTLHCDSCYFSKHCPEYKKRSTCGIDWSTGSDIADPKTFIDVLIQLQEERIQIARAAELADGGIPDQTLSNEMDRLKDLIALKRDFQIDKFSLHISGQQQNSDPKKPGLLSQLLSGMSGNQLPENKVPAIEEGVIKIPVADIQFDEAKLEEPKGLRANRKVATEEDMPNGKVKKLSPKKKK